MGVENAELEELFRRPEVVYWNEPKNAWTVQRGRLAAGVRPATGDDGHIVTVLWRYDEDWAAALDALPADRYVPAGIAS